MRKKYQLSKEQITWGITIFLTAAAVLILIFLMFNGSRFAAGVQKLTRALAAIITGIIISYVLSPILNFIEKYMLTPIYRKRGIDVGKQRKKKSQMRKISVTMTILIFLLIIYALVMIIVPQLIASIRSIVQNLPIYADNVSHFFNDTLRNNPKMNSTVSTAVNQVMDMIQDFVNGSVIPQVGDLVQMLSGWAVNIVKGVFNFIIGIIVAVYLLYSKDRFCAQGKKIAYSLFKEPIANELVGACRFTHYTFIGFITGKIFDSIIIGIMCFIGTKMVGTPFPVLVSFIVGFTNIIPFFGPYIGAIIGSILVFMIDPVQSLIFLIFVIILQQFDGNILGPKILGDSTGLSSFWVIFAIMFFGAIWGIPGWIVGVPLFAVLYHGLGRLFTHFLGKKNLPLETEDYYDVAYVENGEVRPLSDKNNTKYNSVRPGSAWKRVIGIPDTPSPEKDSQEETGLPKDETENKQ